VCMQMIREPARSDNARRVATPVESARRSCSRVSLERSSYLGVSVPLWRYSSVTSVSFVVKEVANGQLVLSHADVMIAFVWRLEC
jgi:hypothetical protein